MKNPPASGYTFEIEKNSTDMIPAVDARGAKVRGLWRRGSLFYGQLSIASSNGKKTVTKRALGTFSSVGAAYAALEAFRKNVREGQIKPVVKWTQPQFDPTPTAPSDEEGKAPAAVRRNFAWLANRYLTHTEKMQEKAASTIRMEKYTGSVLVKSLGEIPLDRLAPHVIRSYIHDQVAAGKSGPRFLNSQLAVLRAIAAYARLSSLITVDFVQGVDPLVYKKKEFPLVTAERIQEFCEAVQKHCAPLPAERLLDFVRFLAFSGARRGETLKLRWTDVDFDQEQVVLRAVTTKNGKPRFVDFNGPLKAHLLAMKARRDARPEWQQSELLFPSPQNRSVPHGALGNIALRVENRSGLSLGGFHNLRRYFASWCVMQKVDFLTIAKWLGHSDGGRLLTQTYARLSSPHTKAMAQSLQGDAALAA